MSLSRGGARRAAPPVRLVHLGLGNFVRAHLCWYTEHAPDAGEWGITAFSGRARSPLVEAMRAQDCLFTLVTRDAASDRFEVIASVAGAHAGADQNAWLGLLADQRVAAVTLTITEAGYCLRADRTLDLDHEQLRGDLQALRHDHRAPVRSAPARLLAGLDARRRAGAGPLAIVSLDNLAGNGAILAAVVRELAEQLDPDLTAWIAGSVTAVATMVDRITPRTTAQDQRSVLAQTGVEDRCAVVTEPFSEWVLSGAFPAGRPRWEEAGARFSEDLSPFERRKLWLLNGGHSLLAYAGSIRGHELVSDAIADDRLHCWLEQWWSEACSQLTQPADELARYRATLLERWANPRIAHRLAQIAADGSQKLPNRIVPVLRAGCEQGTVPEGAARILAAWVCHLRGSGAPVSDPRAGELAALAAGPLAGAVPRVIGVLDPALAQDSALVRTVTGLARELVAERPPHPGREVR